MTSYFDETGLADIFLEEEAPPRRTSSPAPRAASSPIWRAREADVWAAAKAAPEARPPVLSVSELLGRLERSIERAAEGCWVRGEVTDLRVSAAGHQYFRLKDSGGVLSCVLFRGRSAGRRLETGASIEAFGRMDVYRPQGAMQLTLEGWRPAGMGALYEAFLRLKAKLEAEGLFRAELKRALPPFVRRIALVTSPAGAALHDVLRTLERRTPWIEVTLVEAPVQGADAAARIVRALSRADRLEVDCVLLVRGGGSYEDLQAFNDEALARKLRRMRHPVVAGIGHESDVTIADLAADLRASTPTAAAESVGPDREHWRSRLAAAEASLGKSCRRSFEASAVRLDRAELLWPRKDRLLERHRERLGQALMALRRTAALAEDSRAARLAAASRWISAPSLALEAQRRKIESARLRLELGMRGLNARLEAAVDQCGRRFAQTAALAHERRERALKRAAKLLPDPAVRLEREAQTLRRMERTLEALDPERPLRAGYAIVEAEGRLVTSAADLAPGRRAVLRFADGRVRVASEGPADGSR